MAQKVVIQSEFDAGVESFGLMLGSLVAAPFKIAEHLNREAAKQDATNHKRSVQKIANDLRDTVFVYNIENIGFDFIPLKYIYCEGSFAEEAEVQLLTESLKIGANAILNFSKGNTCSGTAVIIKDLDAILDKYPEIKSLNKYYERKLYNRLIPELIFKYENATEKYTVTSTTFTSIELEYNYIQESSKMFGGTKEESITKGIKMELVDGTIIISEKIRMGRPLILERVNIYDENSLNDLVVQNQITKKRILEEQA